MTRFRVGVVGGGISGLCTALFLRAAGHHVTVFEASPVRRAGGGALIVWGNAVGLLDRVGLRATLLRRATIFSSYEFRTWGGSLVGTLPVASVSERYGAPSLLVPRSALVEVLEHALCSAGDGGGVRYGHSLSHIESGERPRLHFEGSQPLDFDLIVGADGIHSRVRSIVQGDSPSREGRRRAFLAVTPFEHLLLEPGIVTTTLGPGPAVLLAALNDGQTYWYVTVPQDVSISGRTSLIKALQRAHEPIREVIEATPESNIVTTVVRDRRPAVPWSVGRVTLVGDAVHCSSPDLGQGAGQSVESAAALADALSVGGHDVNAALRAYEESRFGRAAEITAFSRGAILQDLLENESFAELWPVAMRGTLPTLGPRVLDWVLGATGKPARSKS